MFFCGDACAHRHEVTQFLPLEEAAEGMGRGPGLPVLPQARQHKAFQSQTQTKMGKSSLGST